MIAPTIISASRVTDIPAFHARWLMDRIRAGHCVRPNPRNPRQCTEISFSRCRCLVFWSKNPENLLPYLAEIHARGHEFYLQFTLNDYVREGLEPGLPPLSARLDVFRRFADCWGPERIVWRFDPLIVGTGLGVGELSEKIDRLGRLLCRHTDTLVFSLADMYAVARRRLRGKDPALRPPDAEETEELAKNLASTNAGWAHPLRLTTCAEGCDLGKWGIEPGACIDPERIGRLCGVTGNRPQQASLLPEAATGTCRTDPSQRKLCRCAPSRDIGMYDTCLHGCLYCYAIHSAAAVRSSLMRRQPGSASLVPLTAGQDAAQ